MRVWTCLVRPFGLLCLLTLAWVPPTRAQETEQDPKQEAKARYTSGQSHYNLNEFKAALDEFKEAYRLYPDPVFLFNVAQCERQLGDFDEAIKFYRSYLRNKPKAPNRAEVLRRIDEMQAAANASKSSGTPPARDEVPPKTAGDSVATDPPPVVATTPATPPPPTPTPTAAPEPEPKVSPSPVPSQSAPPSPLPPTRADLVTPAPPPAADESPSVLSRWWFWTGVAAVVATGVGSAVILSRGTGSSTPESTLGNRKVF
jgi:hypothetical protein